MSTHHLKDIRKRVKRLRKILPKSQSSLRIPHMSHQIMDEKIIEDNTKEEDSDDNDDKEIIENLLQPSHNEELSIDFRFCDSQGEEDEMWIRTLVNQGFTGKCILSHNDTLIRSLTKVLATQLHIGTYVKPEEEEAIYAFMSVIDARQFLSSLVIEKLHLPQNKKIGWVIREKIINVPDDVTSPLLTCLKDDLLYSFSKGLELEYDMYLLFAPCFVDDTQEQRKEKKKQKMKNKTNYSFTLFEDIVFEQHALHTEIIHFSRPPPNPDIDNPPESELSYIAKALLVDKKSFLQVIEILSKM